MPYWFSGDIFGSFLLQGCIFWSEQAVWSCWSGSSAAVEPFENLSACWDQWVHINRVIFYIMMLYFHLLCGFYSSFLHVCWSFLALRWQLGCLDSWTKRRYIYYLTIPSQCFAELNLGDIVSSKLLTDYRRCSELLHINLQWKQQQHADYVISENSKFCFSLYFQM